MKIAKTTILLEVTRAEKAKLELLAKQRNTTVSNYLRTQAFGYERK
jgi:hypothetical protein